MSYTVKEVALGMVAAVSISFAIYEHMDRRHAHPADIVERDLASQSTRYAEIVKFYVDRLKAGEQLTDAELARLELAQRQQERIAGIIGGDDDRKKETRD